MHNPSLREDILECSPCTLRLAERKRSSRLVREHFLAGARGVRWNINATSSFQRVATRVHVADDAAVAAAAIGVHRAAPRVIGRR